MDTYSLKTGEKLVKFSRDVIESWFEGKSVNGLELLDCEERNKLLRCRGVFVTLKRYPSKSFRGGFGYISPMIPLYEAVREVTIIAAFYNPNYLPLSKSELKTITVELSIILNVKKLEVERPEEYLEKIKIGKYGIIVEKDVKRAILLPQIAIDKRWNVKQFLSNACIKAGLSYDAYMNPETTIRICEVQVFEESEPGGGVIERKF